MNLKTISEVSKEYGISPRMIRYYEKVGLIKSQRKDGYAYRVYDKNILITLQQIIILRKLRVPVKQIINILSNSDTAQIVELLRQNINQIDKEITALSTIKSILVRFSEEIQEKTSINLHLFGDDTLLLAINSLSFPDNQIKVNKEEITMEDLNKASDTISELTDVRIIYLPPMTVATISAIGDNCEDKANEIINQFVKENNLLKIKPDIRHFGFDCSMGEIEIGENSKKYQVWISVPDDMEIFEPFIKRRFSGGLYASHMIKMGDFHHWSLLNKWVKNSDKYEVDSYTRCEPFESDMDCCFEEQLNYWGNLQNKDFNSNDMQMDLLFPIKEKNME